MICNCKQKRDPGLACSRNVGRSAHDLVRRFSHALTEAVTTAPRINIASNPSITLGVRDGKNQTLTAPTENMGANSKDTRTCTSVNFLRRQAVMKATAMIAAPTANQPLHNNRRKKLMVNCPPPNVRAEAGRGKRVRHETGGESRPCLQHAR